jgi:hypothetical protein
LEDLQAVFDGEAGRDDEEASGEALALGMADGVDGLPGDDHGHDGGFPGAGGEFECNAKELWVGFVVGVGQIVEEAEGVLETV